MSAQVLTKIKNEKTEGAFSSDQIELMKRTVCVGATNDEFAMFLGQCVRTGLDPLSKQIYAIKRPSAEGMRMVIHVGIDGLRLVADRSGNYMPGKSPTFEMENGQILSCTSYGKKRDSSGVWHDIESTVYFREYAAFKKDGSMTQMWRDKPRTMIGKCAESSLLRKAFPADLSGLYSPEEFSQSDVAHTPGPQSAAKTEKKPEITIDHIPVEEKTQDTGSYLMRSEDASLLELDIEEKTDATFRAKAMEYFSRTDGKEITSCYDLTNRQAELIRKWMAARPKKKEEEIIANVPYEPTPEQF